ncbi:hypothetical protein LMH87_000822 [Akanthomyces muscarius]|uniref:Uncharacterized protein n=1 Tax=Akanthomyces muscarius TaxID=2231603 RepID=A0A9W8UP81_AKAMU|nr:hypothetical protein LMH87_000822 [Akanthomyces muscarius]KAJ4155585.1 hypothetical protein LMH87_000822 [Akanthomyces muscarius]
MSGSTDATAATPAWKKLGLKLKHSNANEAANGTPAVGHPDRAQQGSMQGKRKHAASAASDYSSPLSAKKPRRDFSKSSTGDATPQLTRKKLDHGAKDARETRLQSSSSHQGRQEPDTQEADEVAAHG